ncbi:SprT-like domain-containing protein [Candidatus Nitrospira bockiana]
MIARPALAAPPLAVERLQQIWQDLNARYCGGRLPAIPILWSARLTASAGMFASRVGPRASELLVARLTGPRRVIRLSLPLLSGQPEAEIVGTLAHEMIHQWQYDVLKRRPDHGPDFCRLMTVMNRDGLGITIRHNLDDAIIALSRYTWRCQECGRDYHRQRRSIRPRQHRCGVCSGRLREVVRPAAVEDVAVLVPLPSHIPPIQIALPFMQAGPAAAASLAPGEA